MAGTLQSNGGDLLVNSIQGNGVPFTKPIGSVVFADANQTPASAVYQCPKLNCTGTNTAQRNLVLPLVSGAEWYVCNNGTGYGIEVIGASGAGIVIANNHGAMVWTDGTNFYRLTLDATITS
jgi:hypothetical protein